MFKYQPNLCSHITSELSLFLGSRKILTPLCKFWLFVIYFCQTITLFFGMRTYYSSLLILLVLCFQQTFGQLEQFRELEVGLSITGNGYYGDLNHNPDGLLKSDHLAFNPGINIHVRKAHYQRLLPVFNAGYGEFLSQNPDIQPVTLVAGDPPESIAITPNRFVETSFIYMDFGYRLQLVRKFTLFSPYLGLSVGGLAFYPHAEDGILLSRKRSTRAPGEKAYGTMTLSAPVTLGMDVNLGRKLSLNLAYIYRMNGTDYLDNIKTLGTHAGNDKLHILRFGASFRIRNKKPDQSEPREQEVPMDSILAVTPPIAEDTSVVLAGIELEIVEDSLPEISDNRLSRVECDSLIGEYELQLAAHIQEVESLQGEIRELNLLVMNTARERDEFQVAVETLQGQLITGKQADQEGKINQYRLENRQLRQELAETKILLTEAIFREETCMSDQDLLGGKLEASLVKIESQDRQIRLLNQQIEALEAAIEALKIGTPEVDDSQLVRMKLSLEAAEKAASASAEEQKRLMQENARLSALRDSLLSELEQLEQSQGQLASVLSGRSEEMQDIEERLATSQLRASQTEANLQGQIDSLKVALVSCGETAPEIDPAIIEKLQELSAKEDAISAQAAKLKASEVQLVQREAMLKESRAAVAEREKKYADLVEKEKYLKQLEQQLKQYANTLRDVNKSPRQEKIAAFSIPCSLGKKIVQERIVSHFAAQGYTYMLEKGKLVYLGVVLPEISPNPINISLYLIRDDVDDRQLLGTFRLENGDYLSDARYPEESRNAKNFMRQFVK